MLRVSRLVWLLGVSVACHDGSTVEPRDGATEPTQPGNTTFASLGKGGEQTLLGKLYATSKWSICQPSTVCGSADSDWGADSLTYALYFRWSLTRDAAILPILSALNAGGPTYGTCLRGTCTGWSDVPEWDSIAASREYEATGDASALTRAEDAFGFVDTSNAFAIGACPAIDYQAPSGGTNQLKTLETDSNYIKAALLLHDETGNAEYLAKAEAKYASVRQYFVDPSVPLYTVYVVDTGTACTQIPRRFFGSVNGNMILNGLLLHDATGTTGYRDDAIATATALDHDLSDPGGVYEDLQAENDVTEPLVEAFYRLATAEGQAFARAWLLRNASASATDLDASGSYGRFWGGPAPTAATTAWQTNGGLALAFAAADIAPTESPTGNDIWRNVSMTSMDITTLPATVTFTGSAIALFGTIGEECCESGHARLFIDGVESFDQTGIWQNKSSSGRSLPGSVLFAWRWPSSGAHTIGFSPGVPNPKEGTSFLHVQGYMAVP